MADISLTIGEKILIYRRRNGFSRKQLANIIGVTVSTVSNYENGVTLPDMHTLSKIAATLNVRLDLLVIQPEFENSFSHMHKPKLTQSQTENMI